MKIENLQRAHNLASRLKSVNSAITECEGFLSYSGDCVDGIETTAKNRVYSFHLSVHSDGSGRIADLTNCGIATKVVGFALIELKNEKEDIEKEISTL